jgi:drug/metabolite transporter (DMT)-like permease
MRRWIGAAIGFAGLMSVEFRSDAWSWHFGWGEGLLLISHGGVGRG